MSMGASPFASQAEITALDYQKVTLGHPGVSENVMPSLIKCETRVVWPLSLHLRKIGATRLTQQPERFLRETPARELELRTTEDNSADCQPRPNVPVVGRFAELKAPPFVGVSKLRKATGRIHSVQRVFQHTFQNPLYRL